MSILSMRMSTSPGNSMNMMTSWLGLAARAAKPMIPPRITPRTVSTNSRFSLHHAANYNNTTSVLETVQFLQGITNYYFQVMFWTSIGVYTYRCAAALAPSSVRCVGFNCRSLLHHHWFFSVCYVIIHCSAKIKSKER